MRMFILSMRMLVNGYNVARSNARLINTPAFMDAKNLQPFISKELEELIKPIEYSDCNQLR